MMAWWVKSRQLRRQQKKDAPVGHREVQGGRSVCPRRADKNPRPPPGPGDAGVNGAEVSAPPGSEKPT
ncbi:MAG: hypothetical protein E7034_09920, partial [Akkermansiaceae bacterium]|nr:hypothetical protein [Akkermansiaceae bacterium]